LSAVPLTSLHATRALAARTAKSLSGRELVLLCGDLGAGKTTFVRYLAQALGIDPAWVSSPSFTLIQRYPAGTRGVAVTHVDLYRIAGPADLEALGLDDLLASDDLVVVEWPHAAEALWEDSGRRIIRIEFGRDAVGRREAVLGEEERVEG
jgi:tRNA threonylcarbamoyladenosine biosynthesis protein TsaE